MNDIMEQTQITSLTDCERRIGELEELSIENLVRDRRIPQTYRSIFIQYLVWKSEQLNIGE